MRRLSASIILVVFAALMTSTCGHDGGDSGSIVVTESFTVSGAISIGGVTLVDSDTNDPNAAFASNNTTSEAQAIPSAVTVGGYLSFSATNESGDRFSNTTDLLDIYRAQLSDGQVISLSVADFDVNNAGSVDIDLLLYRTLAPDSVVASSVGQDSVESLAVPGDDDYYIVVAAVRGASNYVLSIGSAPLSTHSQRVMRLEDAFVSGEAVARQKPALSVNGVSKTFTSIGIKALATNMGLSVARGGNGRPALLRMNRLDSAIINAVATITEADVFSGMYGLTLNPEQRKAYETIKAVKQLRNNPAIASADLNYIRQASFVPNDTFYSPYQWHYPLINLPQAWDISRGVSTVLVAVVDTGVYLAHTDLSANLSGTGYDMVSSTLLSNDGDGIDDDPNEPTGTTISGIYHGTHVSGTIAAVTDNDEGVAGVAPDVKLMPVRVLGLNGLGTDYDIIQGIRYAARLSNDSGTRPHAAADIINLSLGGEQYSQTVQDTITEVRAAGLIIVAAAGNNGDSVLMYPASYDGVISVSAVGPLKTLTDYSSFGSAIDMSAPGGDFSVDTNGDGFGDGVASTGVNESSGSQQSAYNLLIGTSMAAPHVSGVIALMKSVYPSLTPAELDAIIAQGEITQDLSADGESVRNDSYGYGMIDALKAVQKASEIANGSTVISVLTVSPSTASLPVSTSTLQLTVSKSGDTALSITGFNTSVPWASLTPASVDASGFGIYTLTVNRASLSDGTYQITATFTADTGNTAESVITVLVSSISYDSNAGHHYILLIDSTSGDIVSSGQADASDGKYLYTVTGVPAGTYFIVTATNHDNDEDVCDAGEACGGYPVLGSLESVVVNSDSQGYDMTSSYNEVSAFSVPRDLGSVRFPEMLRFNGSARQ